jgi:hypothetical protein
MTGEHNVIRYVDEDGTSTFDLVNETLPNRRLSDLDGEILAKPNEWARNQWGNHDD